MSARFPRVVLTVPFVPQRRNGECLVACAMMSLSYLGQQPDYLRIARQLDSTSIGTPFPNIRRLADDAVHVLSGCGTLQILYQHLSQGQPCIVSVQTGQLPHWNGEDFAHAAVVVGMDAERQSAGNDRSAGGSCMNCNELQTEHSAIDKPPTADHLAAELDRLGILFVRNDPADKGLKPLWPGGAAGRSGCRQSSSVCAWLWFALLLCRSRLRERDRQRP